MTGLRRIGADDWRLWRDVRLRALAEAPHAFGSTLAQWQGEDLEPRWRARLDGVPLNVVAFGEGGSPVGQVSGSVLDGDDGRVELISMWVAPEVRGRGVGEALIAEVVRWAGARGAPAIVLSVKVGNDPAASLYRRMGFERTDEPADEGEVRMERRPD